MLPLEGCTPPLCLDRHVETEKKLKLSQPKEVLRLWWVRAVHQAETEGRLQFQSPCRCRQGLL